MSILSKALKGIGHAVGHGVHELGGIAEKAAPIVGLVPGVGTLAGGLIGGVGALAHGDGLGGALRYGAEGATSGYAGGGLRGLLKDAGTAVTSGGGPSVDPTTGDPLPAGGSAPSSGGFPGSGVLGTIWNNLPSSTPGQPASTMDKYKLGLSALEGANAAYNQYRTQNRQDTLANRSDQYYKDTAPIRAQGIAMLKNPQAPDLSSLDAIRGQLPIARY